MKSIVSYTGDMILYILMIFFLAKGTYALIEKRPGFELRRQPEPEAPSIWDACLTEGMTGAECEAHILSTVGGDLANHPMPDLKIKYHNQRSPEEYSDTYYMYGVPTNLKGEVDCNLNEGHIIYPWEWIGSDGSSYEIPQVPCAGLDAIACCTAVEKMMKDQGIPLTDLSGNCFSCWVHQEPLIPRLDSDSGDVVYVDYSYSNISKTCHEVIYTRQEVQEEDLKTQQQVSEIVSWIDGYFDCYSDMDIYTCRDFLPLQKDMLLHAR